MQIAISHAISPASANPCSIKQGCGLEVVRVRCQQITSVQVRVRVRCQQISSVRVRVRCQQFFSVRVLLRCQRLFQFEFESKNQHGYNFEYSSEFDCQLSSNFILVLNSKLELVTDKLSATGLSNACFVVQLCKVIFFARIELEHLKRIAFRLLINAQFI